MANALEQKGSIMMRAWFAAVLVSMTAVPTFAQDKLKLAIGQIDAWSNQVPTLGMHAGIFQKHGIALENFGTQGAGETIQAMISEAPISASAWARPAPCVPSPRAARFAACCRLYRRGRYLLVRARSVRRSKA